MKLLFVHDGPVFRDEEGRYYEYSYHGLYDRYSYLADQISFLMRVEPITAETKGTLIPKSVELKAVPNFKTPMSYILKKSKAERIIKEAVKESDILILRHSSCASIALKYAKKFQKPYIYECVGCSWDSMWNHGLLGKLLAPYAFLEAKCITKNAPYVYYVTDRFLQKRYPTRGKWVGCSNVEISKLDEKVLTDRLKRRKIYSSSETIKVGTAAAIDVRYKGQEYVLYAIKKLQERGLDIVYYLAGGNRTNSRYLEELAISLQIEERVKFVGSLDAKEMLDFYDMLDVYIQPSLQEGLPRSVIEAMSRGCPVIGSNIAGIPELLDSEYLFKKGNVEQIISRIESLLDVDISPIAERNFLKSKEYEKEVLEQRRKTFYDMFLNECVSDKYVK